MDEAALKLMWAERACERLVYRYAWLVDSGEAAGIADLFTEDGVLGAGDGEPMRGRGGVRRRGADARARRHPRKVLSTTGGHPPSVSSRHDERADRCERRHCGR